MHRQALSVQPYPPDSIYAAIDANPRDSEYLPGCVAWLREQGLLFQEADGSPVGAGVANHQARRDILVGVPTHQCYRKSGAELDKIKRRYKDRPLPGGSPTGPAVDALWTDYQRGRDTILSFSISPVSADAIACYWPFHIDPTHWGIYISVQSLLEYTNTLLGLLAPKLYCLGNLESILTCVLFEIFHHEFFHHIVESTATTLEILSAAFGEPQPIYRAYSRGIWRQHIGPHPHEPLEEALANAYAHNSFGFISRVKIGYRSIQARLYQEVLRRGWLHEGDGYRHAGYYVGAGDQASSYVSGGAQLFALLLNSISLAQGAPRVPDPQALLLLAQRVMPRGHTAFIDKPHIPAFLVGSAELVQKFLELVPAPNETYTSLFWPRDTSEIDKALQARKRKNRKKALAARASGR
jgi:hypothetical protein